MTNEKMDKDRQFLVDQGCLGNEPSEEYMDRVTGLDNIVRECMHVSQSYSGIRSPTGRHYYASVLFTALVTRGVSLLNLVPHTPWASKLIEHWDYASAAGITRTILEIRLAFFYLCVDSCSDEEWNCRWNIFNLHDCKARMRMFESIPNSDGQLVGFEEQAEELRDRLRNNLYFQSLISKQQSKFLRGQTAYMIPLEDIGEKVGINKSTFRWLYVLLSSHVHGLPMSFYRIGSGEDERGRGLPSPIEENYTSLCLSFVMTLMVGARDELHALFEGLIPEQPIQSTDTEKQDVDDMDVNNEFKIGGMKTILDNGIVRIDVVRELEDYFIVKYILSSSNELVLQKNESEEGSTLEWFDPVFWNITINGEPATEKIISEIENGNFAYRVDLDERTLQFKTK
ncbi:DUF5677 domain-containing protein [Lonsdalea quercina]|uniref:DUF5677 domain-containing protein n=1 Tax=Lonsdalea quercina TaxID=71657 RepID=UPI0039756516